MFFFADSAYALRHVTIYAAIDADYYAITLSAAR